MDKDYYCLTLSYIFSKHKDKFVKVINDKKLKFVLFQVY